MIQHFPVSGTWHKPIGAISVDIMTCGAGAGGSDGQDGANGELTVQRFNAADLPGKIEVEVGKGGRGSGNGGDGADGYALVVTHMVRTEPAEWNTDKLLAQVSRVHRAEPCWVMDLDWYKQVRRTAVANGMKDDGEDTWVPAPDDRMFSYPVHVRDDGGEPHIEWLTPDERSAS